MSIGRAVASDKWSELNTSPSPAGGNLRGEVALRASGFAPLPASGRRRTSVKFAGGVALTQAHWLGSAGNRKPAKRLPKAPEGRRSTEVNDFGVAARR
ncbi:hypothetical protein PCANC_00098 [Puccinia coronata f. sp. avenae]|uniref:Uncharacterized protein n=1 Tax=Puccinia coronata f. sp. avenae TaxID=200324 RepID=A0A2N5W8P3_9BASI|nr:hypothetical protein PCANC_25993 [Puccinia coronata f. sp. avenae]PLW19580.1 hypothetical protein PCASD_21100 [Puccinia coronata f. sp. avenae]PLW46372.1 hypothetical protein PCASD_05462 [Puccinia coronata f. sp. avenae]PLW58597.1 hypothetical protein PCANC_00098 [Puccinia coronata f. sp. avenae]